MPDFLNCGVLYKTENTELNKSKGRGIIWLVKILYLKKGNDAKFAQKLCKEE
jgi:hypothetical protein